MILGGQPPGKVGRSQLEKALENISGAFFLIKPIDKFNQVDII